MSDCSGQTIIERKVTGYLIGYPLKLCYRCGRETAHSPDEILCCFCGLTTYDDEGNLRNFNKYYNSSSTTIKKEET